MDKFAGKWEVVSTDKCDDFFKEAGMLCNHLFDMTVYFVDM